MIDEIRVGIVEVQTAAARELIHRLLRHPKVKITALQSSVSPDTEISAHFGELRGRPGLPTVTDINHDILKSECHAVFNLTGHGKGLETTPILVENGLRVFDLSSDFRFRDNKTYRKAFEKDHPCPEWNLRAVYGLPEIYRPEIPGRQLVAMPGNYATAVLLGLAPLMKRDLVRSGSIVADCKGGYSTARGFPDQEQTFSAAYNNIMPHYPRWRHQQPEMEEQLKRLAGETHEITFVPHVFPIDRGILATIYVWLSEQMDQDSIQRLYERFYAEEPFIRVLENDLLPRTAEVVFTNYCDIATRLDIDGRRLVIFTALDNLTKGSAGQAMQCMNLSYGIPETEGLE